MIVLPVMPGGEFVPGLNAIVLYECRHETCADDIGRNTDKEIRIKMHYRHISTMIRWLLRRHCMGTIIIVPHYWQIRGGRDARFTLPWNTCAIWDVNKLALT
ncbi:hypothetical protein ACHAW5_002200 [Stephanodiscus triporus]|uniref:Uncharacterized protein n=1 Tax=Stephanodiscus triporus TaxID=2934178 RepID=A0ABD3MS77_9STRA